ncbi:uncharacterized protein LOC121967911 [Zingiber officinale]|uniref:uncharacterized protein LOC121967911 n=1 Tax=Zingiber officinale TaxID=94328 RepID=UPI001C4C04D3|nr:uncharacterized protein LOC121967911 [Zingiber officinale]
MDLETENRLASLLLEEARRLCAEAEKGVHVYLHMPSVRCQLNSRFLTAAVLGVHTTRLILDYLNGMEVVLDQLSCFLHVHMRSSQRQ